MNTGWCMIFILDMEIVASSWAEEENDLQFICHSVGPMWTLCAFALNAETVESDNKGWLQYD